MIIAIIAGGSGTRLWPLSTPEYPKHLLSLTSSESMLQRTYVRAQRLATEIYVITEKSHSSEVAKQLPKLKKDHIIIEPARRNTASCLLLGLERIKKHHITDEPVVFMAADHHIIDDEGFCLTIETAVDAAKSNQAITLIGLEPRYPATGFGYIQKGTRVAGNFDLPVYQVASFKEKPKASTAKQYLSSGKYLWNMGLFAAPVSVFESSVKKHCPELYGHYTGLLRAKNIDNVYKKFPDLQFDKSVIEKDKNVLVVPGTFGWADIGSFLDLYHVVDHDEAGNFIEGHAKLSDANNNYVYTDSKKPLLVIGLDNIVVVNTKDGIVITRRDHSQQVGPTIKQYWEETKK